VGSAYRSGNRQTCSLGAKCWPSLAPSARADSQYGWREAQYFLAMVKWCPSWLEQASIMKSMAIHVGEAGPRHWSCALSKVHVAASMCSRAPSSCQSIPELLINFAPSRLNLSLVVNIDGDNNTTRFFSFCPASPQWSRPRLSQSGLHVKALLLTTDCSLLPILDSSRKPTADQWGPKSPKMDVSLNTESCTLRLAMPLVTNR
jgi:hypothetical protein